MCIRDSTWTQLSVVPGQAEFALQDKLTNHADYENEYQIIYHGNFGAPILDVYKRQEQA